MGLTRPGDPDEADFYYFKRLPCDSTRHIDEKRGEFEQFFAAKGDTVRSFMGKHLGPVGRVVGGVVGGVVAAVPRGPVGRWITDRATGITRFSCPLTTIASVMEQERIDEIALLKVDVEGAEMEVLAGVGDANWPRVRQLALEGHDKDGRLEEARALCQRAGFDAIHVMHPQISIDRGLANFVLIARRTPH
jgi:hypothetical protein